MKNLYHFVFLLCFFIFNTNSGIAQSVYFSNSIGDLDNLASWGTNSDGSGTNPGDFNTVGDVFKIRNRTTVTHSGTYFWLLTPSVTVQIGDSINPINFIYGPGDLIADGKWNIAPNASLTINEDPVSFSVLLNTLSINSTVIYNYPSATILIPTTAQYGNLEIQDNATIPSGPISLSTRTLNISANKTFSVGSSNTVIINQNVAGTGSINAQSGNITLSMAGSGNRGSLNTVGSVSSFSIVTSTAGFVTLGNDLSVTGDFSSASTSGIDLNGKTLTLGGNITFPTQASNALRGSSASRIVINGSGNINNSLRINSTSNTLQSLVLNRSAALTMTNTNLNITDSLSVLSGTLNTSDFITLKSTSTLKGRIGRVGGVINGDVTVETFIPGTSTGWANLGVTGVSGQNVKSWDTYSTSSGADGVPMTCNGCDYDENSLGSYFVSIQDWTEATGTYSDMVSTDNLTPGKGYWVYVGTGLSSTSDLKLVNSGPPVTGTVGVTLTSAGTGTNKGFNLVANPYASPISWAKVLAASVLSTSINNAIYVWNADLNAGSGGYAEYVGGTSTPSGISGISDIIPAGQGFYVETPLIGALLVFNENSKMTNNTGSNPLLRPATPSSIGKILRLKLNGSYTDWDEAVFRIHDDATSVFDGNWDARKILQSPGYVGYPGPYSHYTTISSKDGLGEDYSINSIPPLTQSVSIPVMVRGMATGNYTITATEYADINDCIMIKDKLTNVTQDLKMGSYVFSLNDTTMAPRFELILCKDQSLGETTAVNQITNNTTNNVLINQDAQGAYVKTAFEKDTKAVISAYNIMGQKIMDDMTVNGTVNTTYLPLNTSNQVVFINVNSNTGKVSKKILLH